MIRWLSLIPNPAVHDSITLLHLRDIITLLQDVTVLLDHAYMRLFLHYSTQQYSFASV